MKYGTAERHMVPLGRAKFCANQCPGVGTRPTEWQKFPLFGEESPRWDEPLDRFLQLLRAFVKLTRIRPTNEVVHITGYRVIAEKPCVSHLPRNFLCTL